MSSKFDLTKYLEKIDDIIKNILKKSVKNKLTYDILDTKKTIKYKIISLKEKQRLMKIGLIWQEVLGNYDKYEDLGIGHETGLDIISRSKKIVIELKNRTNTDNASSKKANLDKLAKFKKLHPEYTCIYGNINDTTELKTDMGNIKDIIHDGVEIKHYIGMALIRMILEENTDLIINFMKECIDKYLD